MKFLDLFSGIGGFRLGLEAEGHECVGFCEIDKFARESYKAIHNTEGEKEWHDITNVSNEEFRALRGQVEIICGGFPCQAFSLAGRRGGFEDTRGTLFFEVARAAEQIQPRFLFLENVKGILSHNEGNTFGTILNTLDELGYIVEWGVFNSKYWGVPQNRERVFIIATRKESFKTPKLIGLLTEQKSPNSKLRDILESYIPEEYFISKEKTSKLIAQLTETGKVLPAHFPTENSINNTLRTGGKGSLTAKHNYEHIAVPVLTPNRIEKRQNGRRFKEAGEPMFTLTAQDKHGVMEGLKIRKLTPRECWRLQGFPDWAFDRAAAVNSDSQLYKQAGNSVTVNVIKAIAKKFY